MAGAAVSLDSWNGESKRNASQPPPARVVSPATRSAAVDANATELASADRDDVMLICVSDDDVDTSRVSPAARSRTNTSRSVPWSAASRFVAWESNATYRPFADTHPPNETLLPGADAPRDTCCTPPGDQA